VAPIAVARIANAADQFAAHLMRLRTNAA